MLREDVKQEQLSQSGHIYGIMCGDEDYLFREAVHNDQDGGEAGGGWQVFNEVHRNGIPRALRNRELFQ